MPRVPSVFIYLDHCVASEIAREQARAAITRKFWARVTAKRARYRGVISEYSLTEVRQVPDAWAATRKILERLYRKLPVFPASASCQKLANDIRAALDWELDRRMDALHVACATLNKVDYFISWDKRLYQQRWTRSLESYLHERLRYSPAFMSPEDFLGIARNPRSQEGQAGVRFVHAVRRLMYRRAGRTGLARVLGLPSRSA